MYVFTFFFSNSLFICHSYDVSVKRGLNWRHPGYIIWYRWIFCLIFHIPHILIYSEQVAKIGSCTYIERDGQCDKVISSHDRWHGKTPCLPYLKIAGLCHEHFHPAYMCMPPPQPPPTPLHHTVSLTNKLDECLFYFDICQKDTILKMQSVAYIFTL